MDRARSGEGPVVSGPIPGPSFLGRPLSYDLASLGYANEEFFLERGFLLEADAAEIRALAAASVW
jgi:hypothetical protein